MAVMHARSRDNARTPVQWDAGPQAGFTSGPRAWLKVNPNYMRINVAEALADPDSIFYYYQKLIRLRKSMPAVVYGRYDLILPEHPQIYAFTRTFDPERLVVMLNFSPETAVFELPAAIPDAGAQLLIGNYAVEADEDLRHLRLRPYEARVYQVKV
jgi:oligo-1,6-glucosidase